MMRILAEVLKGNGKVFYLYLLYSPSGLSKTVNLPNMIKNTKRYIHGEDRIWKKYLRNVFPARLNLNEKL